MKLTWGEYLRLYAPLYLYGFVVIVGAVYGFGYRNGVDSIVRVAGNAAREAKCGA